MVRGSTVGMALVLPLISGTCSVSAWMSWLSASLHHWMTAGVRCSLLGHRTCSCGVCLNVLGFLASLNDCWCQLFLSGALYFVCGSCLDFLGLLPCIIGWLLVSVVPFWCIVLALVVSAGTSPHLSFPGAPYELPDQSFVFFVPCPLEAFSLLVGFFSLS